ncbi:MAG: CheY-like chemotaxis protein [Phenylobacterium sp.]|jgi:CheY-like chemotaxis protein
MKQLKILSVDDNPQNIKLIELSLEEHFEVLSSNGSESLVDLATRFAPDVILLDIMLGEGRNGYDLCKELRDSEVSSSVVVIFISSLSSLEDRLTAFAAGGDDYICKPIDLQVLDQKLRSLEKRVEQHNQLNDQMESASQAAFSSMQQSSELGQLINFFTDTLEIHDLNRLYQASASFVACFGSGLAVEFRIAGKMVQLPSDKVSTLESEILELGRSAKRIITFGGNLLLNSKWCSILIKKMPTHDEELCGRLRDHYAILLGIVDSRLMLMESVAQRATERDKAVVQLSSALDIGFGRIQDQLGEQERKSEEILQKLESSLSINLVSLGLSEDQEEAIFAMVNDTREEFESMMGMSIGIDNEIRSIDQLLHKIS